MAASSKVGWRLPCGRATPALASRHPQLQLPRHAVGGQGQRSRPTTQPNGVGRPQLHDSGPEASMSFCMRESPFSIRPFLSLPCALFVHRLIELLQVHTDRRPPIQHHKTVATSLSFKSPCFCQRLSIRKRLDMHPSPAGRGPTFSRTLYFNARPLFFRGRPDRSPCRCHCSLWNACDSVRRLFSDAHSSPTFQSNRRSADTLPEAAPSRYALPQSGHAMPFDTPGKWQESGKTASRSH